jgi:hypothetical protein
VTGRLPRRISLQRFLRLGFVTPRLKSEREKGEHPEFTPGLAQDAFTECVRYEVLRGRPRRLDLVPARV